MALFQSLLLLLLCLLALRKVAGADDLGYPGRRLVRTKGCREEPADLLLVLSILGIFAGGNSLREDRRALEQHDQGNSAKTGPVVQAVGSVAAPLVEDKPEGLLGKEVGMPAVCPHAGSEETAVELFLLPAFGDLGSLVVQLLCGLKVCEQWLVSERCFLRLNVGYSPHCWPSLMYSLITSATIVPK